MPKPQSKHVVKKLKIDKVSVSKKKINIQEKTDIKFNLTQKALVEINIYDEEEKLVKTIKSKELSPGFNKISWDAKNNQGESVANGVYIYTIKAKNISGEEFIFDLSKSTGGEVVKIENFSIDKETGDISYLLPKASRVRIRMGIQDGGPLLRTLIDWEPKLSGEQKEKWDGKDESGNMLLLQSPDLLLKFYAYALPHNTIIVTGGKDPLYTKTAVKKKMSSQKYFHALHPKKICHEPKIEIEFPKKELKENMPVLKGVTPVIINIAEQDRVTLTDSRYEIIFFIDNEFLFEDEEGYSPFTYLLNTKDIPNGIHFITANIVSYDDHIGVVSKKIIVDNK
jgi:flagellar hook assembly protein FlgD